MKRIFSSGAPLRGGVVKIPGTWRPYHAVLIAANHRRPSWNLCFKIAEDQIIDTELVYSYAKVDRLADMEEFIWGIAGHVRASNGRPVASGGHRQRRPQSQNCKKVAGFMFVPMDPPRSYALLITLAPVAVALFHSLCQYYQGWGTTFWIAKTSCKQALVVDGRWAKIRNT